MVTEVLAGLNDIVSDWTGCTSCELHHTRINQVWFRYEGHGIGRGGMVLIGEAPGADEDEHGEPFVGRAGAKLNRLLADAGVENFFITNTVLCRPPGNRAPKQAELSACWPYLQRVLLLLKPRVIVCAGGVASGWLLEANEKMKRLVATTYELRLGDRHSCMVAPIYHPAYLLRQRSAALDRATVRRLGDVYNEFVG